MPFSFPDATATDNNSSGWFLFDPSKGAGNQATGNKNNKSPVFDAPETTQLNPADAYDQSLKYNAAVGRLAQSQQKDAMAEAGRQSLENYQAKAGIDSRQKLADAQNAGALQNQTGRGLAGGGASITGAGAFVNPRSMADPYGMSGMRTDFGALQDFRDRQGMAAQSMEQFGAIAARNEGAKAREIANAQVDADRQRQGMNIDMMNRQTSVNSQLAAQDRLNQQKLAQLNQQTEIGKATLGAQSSILGSLFGSIGSGNPNYRYWG